ncbi:dihydrofolate reductase family protein [Thermomonospora umbrina]|uniref:Dihydrofolate reductase n=1 Tax=Thermomonospora umbrina TaxID=111806 RepID=A0A3D9SPF5_9ACTN|nr:dihydrofolate reductase family protein [Thermomonospora umbrina]REE95843.1 dihydrofolate reductase [Thermomonospora umbrina]
MRKIISSTYISLDGVIDKPHLWSMQYFNDEAARFANDQLFSCDALIMGRRTYDAFAQAWPSMEESAGEFGVRMNTMPKYAVSTTLEKADWKNTTVISDDVVARVTALKEEPGQDILQYGFGDLSRTLVEHGLLDELRLWIHPVIVGTGDPAEMLTKDGFGTKLELAGTEVFSTGVIIATYRPTAAAEQGEGA